MKRFTALILAAALMVSLFGCDSRDKDPGNTSKTEETTEEARWETDIYSCDPDNMFGFKRAYIDGDAWVLEFERDALEASQYSPYKSYFENGYISGNTDLVLGLTADGYERINGSLIEVDQDNMTLSFVTQDTSPDDVVSIRVSDGGTYIIDIAEESISATFFGGECSESYTQTYDSTSGTWSEPEYEFVGYPLTDEDFEFSPEISADDLIPMDVDYEPQDYGRLIPYVGAYEEDEWEPENDKYLYGFTDMDGNLICDPVFSKMSYLAVYDAFIVGREDNGIIRYGLLSADGSNFTGLCYDGITAQNTLEATFFYATSYEDELLYVFTLDQDFEQTDSDSITIDPGEFRYDSATAGLAVRYIDDDRAVLSNINWFYYDLILVDKETGEVLYEKDESDADLFGRVLLEPDLDGQGISVYDLNGDVILDDADAYCGRVNEDSYMVAREGKLTVYDTDWNEVTSMTIASDAIAVTAYGNIGVFENGHTTLYDVNLDVIPSAADADLGEVNFVRNSRGDYSGDLYVSCYSEDTVTDLNTGAVLHEPEGFYTSIYPGYALTHNLSNGNDPDKRWMLYDGSFNLILEGEGRAYMIEDSITHEMYLGVRNDDTTSIYLASTGELVFQSTDLTHEYVNIMDGRFYCRCEYTSYLLDDTGTVLFSYEVADTV